MKGMISLKEMVASLPEEEQKAIEIRSAELIAQIQHRMTIAEMRKNRKLSQTTMAGTLGIGQMQISRLEKRKDPRLSTMQKTVAAMGGALTMIVTFPDQPPVVLVTEHAPKPKKKAAPKKIKARV